MVIKPCTFNGAEHSSRAPQMQSNMVAAFCRLLDLTVARLLVVGSIRLRGREHRPH
jgi:hypothetical protein